MSGETLKVVNSKAGGCLLWVWRSIIHPLTQMLYGAAPASGLNRFSLGLNKQEGDEFSDSVFCLFSFDYCLLGRMLLRLWCSHTDDVLLPAVVGSDPRSEVDFWTWGRGPNTPHLSTAPPTPPAATSPPPMSMLLLVEQILTSELVLPNQPLHKHTKQTGSLL